MIANKSGSLASMKRHDYAPFGEELVNGARPNVPGYAADSTRQKFTNKERDVETGLDYFGARYYSSQEGRFTSVDPSRKSILPLNPQSWNRYSYTYNNPLALVDNNGKWPTSTHNKIVDRAFDALSKSKREQIKSGSASVDANWGKPVRLLTENTLLEGQAYKHAMTPGSKVRELGSVEAAKNWANAEMYKFIDAKLGEAQRQFQAGENRNGVNNAALVTFGEAMHPIMDNMSPAHRWMQVYDLKPYYDTYQKYANFGLNEVGAGIALNDYRQDMAAHSAEESRDPTQDEMNTMVDQMRMRYLQTLGQEAYEQAVSREERQATERRLRPQRQ
jgi:RHS repeat-associated protein